MNILYTIIAILLAIDNIFIRFRIMGMSYDRWLEFLLFILLIRPYIEELQKNSFFRKLNIYILIFALLQLLINIRLGIVGKIELEDIYTQFLKCNILLSFFIACITKTQLH